jgi:hypothetical protein
MSPADQVMFRRKRRPRRRRSPSCGPTSFRWLPSALAEVLRPSTVPMRFADSRRKKAADPSCAEAPAGLLPHAGPGCATEARRFPPTANRASSSGAVPADISRTTAAIERRLSPTFSTNASLPPGRPANRSLEWEGASASTCAPPKTGCRSAPASGRKPSPEPSAAGRRSATSCARARSCRTVRHPCGGAENSAWKRRTSASRETGKAARTDAAACLGYRDGSSSTSLIP